MKLLFDENLSPRLVGSLAESFPASIPVGDCRYKNTPDDDLWAFAKLHGFVIVSKDSDFYNYSILRGHPPKSIWLRPGNCPTQAIAEVLRSATNRIVEFGEDPIESCLVLPAKPYWELTVMKPF